MELAFDPRLPSGYNIYIKSTRISTKMIYCCKYYIKITWKGMKREDAQRELRCEMNSYEKGMSENRMTY